MGSIAGWFGSITSSSGRAIRRCVIAMLATALVVRGGTHARAEGITPVANDALAQMATETLGQGVMVPFAWEQRVALVGLGVAGLQLGTSTETTRRGSPHSAMRSAAYRLALPLAGAALGNLLAYDSLCGGQEVTAEPLVGAMAGTLIAHVLDRDAGSHTWTSGDGASRLEWTPMVSVSPGSYSVGIMGRF